MQIGSAVSHARRLAASGAMRFGAVVVGSPLAGAVVKLNAVSGGVQVDVTTLETTPKTLDSNVVCGTTAATVV